MFCSRLELGQSSRLLEVASGSGGPALFTAATTGCRIIGVDIHQAGIAEGNKVARERGLAERVCFVCPNARERLSFEDGGFSAVICVDSINHLYERATLLGEWHRLVHSRGRILFTDPITLTGLLRREEMIVRSDGMGEFVFTPPGLDEREWDASEMARLPHSGVQLDGLSRHDALHSKLRRALRSVKARPLPCYTLWVTSNQGAHRFA